MVRVDGTFLQPIVTDKMMHICRSKLIIQGWQFTTNVANYHDTITTYTNVQDHLIIDIYCHKSATIPRSILFLVDAKPRLLNQLASNAQNCGCLASTTLEVWTPGICGPVPDNIKELDLSRVVINTQSYMRCHITERGVHTLTFIETLADEVYADAVVLRSATALHRSPRQLSYAGYTHCTGVLAWML